MEFSDEQIKQILERYKKSIQYNRDRYNTLRKHDEEYQKKNRERSKIHYDSHKDEKKQYYLDNREDINLKQKYRYYKNKDDLEAYKERFPDDYQKLVEMGFIKITS